jgi:hypothetical protein
MVISLENGSAFLNQTLMDPVPIQVVAVVERKVKNLGAQPLDSEW